VLYRFRVLPDWVEAERTLRQTSGVTGIDTVAIGRSYIRVQLHYSGTPEQLAAALAGAQFEFTQAAPDMWQMQRRSAASMTVPL